MVRTIGIGMLAAIAVLLAGGAARSAVRDHPTGDLDRRLAAVSAGEAIAVQATGALSADAADATVAVQVLQSPGTVVDSTGPPADRPMVAEVPTPGTTELSTSPLANDTSAGRSYRVAATTLPTAAGVAGRTVVAAVASTWPIERDLHRVRIAVIALALLIGSGAAIVTGRTARRRPTPSS